LSGSLFEIDPGAGVLPGTTAQLDPGLSGGAGQSGVTLGTGGGQQGHQNVGGFMGSNPFVLVWQWLNKPFQTPMAPADVFMLLGVILVGIIAWNLILYHIRIAAETL
jgi:hypothetical protein